METLPCHPEVWKVKETLKWTLESAVKLRSYNKIMNIYMDINTHMVYQLQMWETVQKK